MTNRIAELAASIKDIHSVGEVDLPYPNIYWVSIIRHDVAVLNRHLSTYIAGEHTASAKAKIHRWCKENHNFLPLYCDSVLKMRRMRLKDILQRPEIYTLALKHAKEQNEADIVKALEAFPEWIDRYLHADVAPLRPDASLWQHLGDQMAAAGL